MTLSQAIEALLFSAQKPLTTSELRDTLTRAGDNDELIQNEFGRVKEAEVAATLGQLKTDYTLTPRGFQLVEKAGGWQLVSHPDCARWVRQLFPGSKPARLSPRFMPVAGWKRRQVDARSCCPNFRRSERPAWPQISMSCSMRTPCAWSASMGL